MRTLCRQSLSLAVVGFLVEMAASLADAVFHQHLWAASARAWMDADLVFFWVWLVSNHLIHAGFHDLSYAGLVRE